MKRLIALLLAVILLFATAACSNDFGAKKDSPSRAAAETAEPSENPESSTGQNNKEPEGSGNSGGYDYDYDDYDYDYDYESYAYQYIWTENCRWIDTDGYWISETYDTYYECSNCGYVGSNCPDYCDSCGAYFSDWDWYDEYYTYVLDAETWSEIVDVYYDVW